MYGHILIPTDGSDISQRGVDHGLALAKALGARVTVMTVTGSLPSYSGVSMGSFDFGKEMMNAYDEQQKRIADAVLTKARADADRLGVSVSVLHVPDARAADAICQAAALHDCSLIVMASHSRPVLGRLLLGSQASSVVNHSPVPVLVVR